MMITIKDATASIMTRVEKVRLWNNSFKPREADWERPADVDDDLNSISTYMFSV